MKDRIFIQGNQVVTPKAKSKLFLGLFGGNVLWWGFGDVLDSLLGYSPFF